MRRFWIEFGHDQIGVTAENEQEALALVRSEVYKGAPLPAVTRLVPDIDVSTLDEERVLANMGVVIWRGIWFPQGYERWKDD